MNIHQILATDLALSVLGMAFGAPGLAICLFCWIFTILAAVKHRHRALAQQKAEQAHQQVMEEPHTDLSVQVSL